MRRWPGSSGIGKDLLAVRRVQRVGLFVQVLGCAGHPGVADTLAGERVHRKAHESRSCTETRLCDEDFHLRGTITQAKERKPIAMSNPVTMRALQQTSLNGPQDLRLVTDAPVPVPGPGEVLIRVAAAGVNFGDIAQAHGTFLGGPQPRTWRASRLPVRSPLRARQRT
jgi:hypothetical protein